MSVNNKIQVLVVDDEVDIQEIIKDLFEAFGFKVTTAGSGNKAWDLIQNNKFEVIISDIRMPDGSGIELIKKLKEKDFFIPKFFFISGYSDYGLSEILDLGAEGLFTKPFEAASLRSNIEKTLMSDRRRWTDLNPPTPEKIINFKGLSVQGAMKKSQLKFGRGGFYYRIRFGNIVVGDLVKFDFSFEEDFEFKKLSGIAKVLWVRPGDSLNSKTEGIGCEIKSISEDSIGDFLNWLADNPMKEYIPIN